VPEGAKKISQPCHSSSSAERTSEKQKRIQKTKANMFLAMHEKGHINIIVSIPVEVAMV
jgi:hypothetical protein